MEHSGLLVSAGICSLTRSPRKPESLLLDFLIEYGAVVACALCTCSRAQACFGDAAGSAPGHCNKMTIAGKQVTYFFFFFWFPGTYRSYVYTAL